MEANSQLFQLGRVVSTPGAADAMMDIDIEAIKAIPKGWDFITTAQGLLQRHATGDWGDMDAEDKASNDASVRDGQGTIGWGNRLMSAYKLSDTLTIWIMTEADRSVTTFLLPEEY